MSDGLRALLYPRGFRGAFILQPWRAWARVARPYRCRTCGSDYAPALSAEIDDKREVYLRDDPSQQTLPGIGSARQLVFDRYNAYAFCRNPGCSCFHPYLGIRSVLPRRRMRRRWLSMPRSANGARYDAHPTQDPTC